MDPDPDPLFPNVDPRIRIHYYGKADPDPLFPNVDPRIWIHVKMRLIRNADNNPMAANSFARRISYFVMFSQLDKYSDRRVGSEPVRPFRKLTDRLTNQRTHLVVGKFHCQKLALMS